MLCDALAGIDRADTKGTSRFSQKVREVFLFETGIDIDALLNGRESKAQTDTKETEGKAKSKETRNNGPPSESYSYAGEIEARDMSNRSELTAEERKNTRPDVDRADVVFADSNESYSIDENLEYELYNVYNGTFDSSKNEVYIGTASNFITDVIGAEAFDNYMPAEKAYRAMATEEKAIFDGKPTGKNINYHGLGVDGLKRILEASENPIAAFAASPDESGKRENRIVLVTDEAAQGGLGIVIQEVDANARTNGKQVKSNKTITVYPKTDIENAISDAIADGRILYIDKKRSQTLHSGRKGSNYPTTISEADFTNNIRRFWENVKWKKSGKAEMSFESGIEAEPEWKKKLREYDSFSAEDEGPETMTAEEAQRRKNFHSTVNKESMKKLVERRDLLEELISDYMRTENLSELMERELNLMSADYDAVMKAIENKHAKSERAYHTKNYQGTTMWRHRLPQGAWITAYKIGTQAVRFIMIITPYAVTILHRVY